VIEGVRSVAASDLDSDGDQDLAVANGIGGDLRVLFQAQPGSFSGPTLVLGGSGLTDGPLYVAAADLDGDGDQDLVAANGGQNLTVFFQQAPGSFQSPPLVLGGPGTTTFPVSIAAADLDADGDEDLVAANSDRDESGNGSNLTIFFQAAPGSFQAAPLVLGGFGVTDGPGDVAAADFDLDGDQDLVCANGGDIFGNGSNLTVFFQLRPRTFQSSPLVLGGSTVTSGPASIAAFDLDSDGDKDIATANFAGKDLTVFWGGR